MTTFDPSRWISIKTTHFRQVCASPGAGVFLLWRSLAWTGLVRPGLVQRAPSMCRHKGCAFVDERAWYIFTSLSTAIPISGAGGTQMTYSISSYALTGASPQSGYASLRTVPVFSTSPLSAKLAYTSWLRRERARKMLYLTRRNSKSRGHGIAGALFHAFTIMAQPNGINSQKPTVDPLEPISPWYSKFAFKRPLLWTGFGEVVALPCAREAFCCSVFRGAWFQDGCLPEARKAFW